MRPSDDGCTPDGCSTQDTMGEVFAPAAAAHDDASERSDRPLTRLEEEERAGAKMLWPPTLAGYGPRFRQVADDHIFLLRILCSEFGLRWQSTPLEDRLALVETEPALLHRGWDAFLAAWVDYHCYHDGIDPPEWVYHRTRVHHPGFWTPIPDDCDVFIILAMVHSPAAFLARGVWIEERELKVV